MSFAPGEEHLSEQELMGVGKGRRCSTVVADHRRCRSRGSKSYFACQVESFPPLTHRSHRKSELDEHCDPFQCELAGFRSVSEENSLLIHVSVLLFTSVNKSEVGSQPANDIPSTF
jgi:hypothetical protein